MASGAQCRTRVRNPQERGNCGVVRIMTGRALYRVAGPEQFKSGCFNSSNSSEFSGSDYRRVVIHVDRVIVGETGGIRNITHRVWVGGGNHQRRGYTVVAAHAQER